MQNNPQQFKHSIYLLDRNKICTQLIFFFEGRRVGPSSTRVLYIINMRPSNIYHTLYAFFKTNFFWLDTPFSCNLSQTKFNVSGCISIKSFDRKSVIKSINNPVEPNPQDCLSIERFVSPQSYYILFVYVLWTWTYVTLPCIILNHCHFIR